MQSSTLSTLHEYILNVQMLTQLQIIKKKITHGNTDLVTMSLLEQLIAAKNSPLEPKKSKTTPKLRQSQKSEFKET